jgi:hypothetical protein
MRRLQSWGTDCVVLILDKRALFSFLYLGLSAGVLSVTTVVHSVPFGWIKLCVRTVVDVWLLSVCKNELLLWKWVESFTYLYVRCPRVSRPHELSPRWVYVFVGGFVACLISLGIGFGVIVVCSTVFVNWGYWNHHVTESCCTSYSLGFWCVVPQVPPRVDVICELQACGSAVYYPVLCSSWHYTGLSLLDELCPLLQWAFLCSTVQRRLWPFFIVCLPLGGVWIPTNDDVEISPSLHAHTHCMYSLILGTWEKKTWRWPKAETCSFLSYSY